MNRRSCNTGDRKCRSDYNLAKFHHDPRDFAKSKTRNPKRIFYRSWRTVKPL
jgi:hypothetical protein